MRHAALCVLLLTAACSRSVVRCADGWVREGDRCVVEDPSTVPQAGPKHDAGRSAITDDVDAATAEPTEEAGAAEADGETGDAGFDAGPGEAGGLFDGATSERDAQTSDAQLDADSSSREGGNAEASTDAAPADSGADAESGANDADVDAAPEPGGDAGSDAQVSDICGEQAMAGWRAFLASDQLTPAIGACLAAPPTCSGAPCDLSVCLRQAAGVTECASCAAQETLCTASACAAACGASDTSDACRACACSEGCIGQTPNCGMGPVDVCADCSGDACAVVSLDPALIMVIVGAM